MRKKAIIFLDVDGPLNTDENINRERKRKRSVSSYHIKLPDRQLYNLARIVHTVRGDVVLSSKWRLTNKNDNQYKSPARKNLERQLYKFGVTIYSQTPFMEHQRGLEINWWLSKFQMKFGYRPPYIVIDDKLDPIIDQHQGHIVYCDPKKGITNKEVEMAINLFRKQNVFIYDP